MLAVDFLRKKLSGFLERLPLVGVVVRLLVLPLASRSPGGVEARVGAWEAISIDEAELPCTVTSDVCCQARLKAQEMHTTRITCFPTHLPGPRVGP